MFDLPFLFSQYKILETTSHWLSTRDLFNLSLTCSDLHASILGSATIFSHLKRHALCDGSGLLARQNYSGRYRNRARKVHGRCYDPEEIEVRLYHLKCDEAGALPCIKCGINVCEECRFVPRFKDSHSLTAFPAPHINDTYQLQNIACHCDVCEPDMERRYGPELCVCNQYTRWICMRCKDAEDVISETCFMDNSKGSWEVDVDDEDGMTLTDHQHDRYFWCSCGTRAPREAYIRCLWCNRRHDTRVIEDDWTGSRRPRRVLVYPVELMRIDYFDEDECYPHTPSRWEPETFWDNMFWRDRHKEMTSHNRDFPGGLSVGTDPAD